ncbi:MAG: putative glycoside hydrolase [Roseiflexaceae bacterium]
MKHLRLFTWRLLLVCVSVLVLVACGSESVPLTGTVTDAYTAQPLASVVVQIGNTKAMTDATGKYVIERWQRTNVLTATSDKYESVTLNFAERQWPDQLTAATATVDIVLRPNTLSGVVSDAWSKQALSGVLVKITDTISATTGADGQYLLRDVPESFTVQVSATDYVVREEALSKTTQLDVALQSGVLAGVVTDQYSGAPLADVVVTAGDVTSTTDAQGAYTLRDVRNREKVVFTREGYATQETAASTTAKLDIIMRPDVLKGKIVDKANGNPIQHATVVATEDLTKVGVASVRMDSPDGMFTLNGLPESGYVFVLAPGYRKLVVPIKQGEIPSEFQMEPFAAKAVYITSAVASNPKLVQKFFDNIDRTELNAIVIDLKSDLRDDLGLVYYDSQVPLVKELGLSYPYYDINAILAEAKRRNIYTIARVHMFSHDNVLAEAKPEWAAQDRVKGGIFYDYPTSTIKYAWLDPFNENVWDYNIALSVEASLAGFDEINFDYIRFPSLEFGADDGARLKLSKENITPEMRYETIKNVLNRAQPAINAAGAYLSVDVFGFTTEAPIDIIGQSIPIMGQTTDYICPMVYPSHYGPGYMGYANPAAYPYEIILGTMQLGLKQMDNTTRARLRPWLQDFTLIWVPDDQIVRYGDAELRAQIKAVADANTGAGWLLYSSDNTYTYSALNPE